MIECCPYIHDIDPVIGTIFGVHLWWYGLSYTLGFIYSFRYLGRPTSGLRLSNRDRLDLILLLSLGVLAGGRVVEVIFYEWPFYGENLHLVPAFWLGGMASHGLLLGGLAAAWVFAWRRRVPFLRLTDALAVPASFILGTGRIGNFIDGQIVGSVTDVWWGVKFPDAEGFRHPVVLYDGIKNLAIVPVLWRLNEIRPPPGVVTGAFLFLYAFLRIPIDLFREYPTSLLGLATGQFLNILMAAGGLVMILLLMLRHRPDDLPQVAPPDDGPLGWRPYAFAAVLLFCLTIPSDWTQDVPSRYGSRHPGLTYSAVYPRISPEPQ